jgi:hypothetical protein
MWIYLGVTKRCRLSWLTNSALAYEPKCGGGGAGGIAGSLGINFGEIKLHIIPMIFCHSQSDSSSEFLSDEESEESQDESEHEYPDRQQQYR